MPLLEDVELSCLLGCEPQLGDHEIHSPGAGETRVREERDARHVVVVESFGVNCSGKTVMRSNESGHIYKLAVIDNVSDGYLR